MLLLLIMLTTPSQQNPTLENQLSDLLKQAQQKSGFYSPPTPDQQTRAEALFLKTLRGNRRADLKRAWRQLGFQHRTVGDVFVLFEHHNRGRGFYLFREGGTVVPTAIQAPHGFHDLHTDDLVLKLFAESRFQAAAFNTIHRHQTLPGSKTYADLSDLDDSYFQCFTRAWAQLQPARQLLQFHGFAKEKRKEQSAQEAAVILSNGQARPNRAMYVLAGYLNGIGAGPVAVYGRDTMELGSTTNAQARHLIAEGHNRFYHFELNLATRQKLLSNAALRADFLIYFKP